MMARLSTHILDTAKGRPAAGVEVRLCDASHHPLKTVTTDADGRALVDESLAAGVYELVFAVSASEFLEEVVVRFRIAEGEPKYHVPLLISPYGYTTYRGS
jgi:5-hydroxyisourate hydrolase